MVVRRRLFLACVMLMGLVANPAAALETDQFTLSPTPLSDIGVELDEHISRVIDRTIESLNHRIEERQAELGAAIGPFRVIHRKQLKRLLAETALAEEIHRITATGLPECTIERWIRTHEFQQQPALFDPSYDQTIYGSAAVFKPLLLGALTPTIRVYGVEQGVDKIGHLFQQGYDYYAIYLRHEAAGRTNEEAAAAAVAWGVSMEETWGGQWWTGAYSNADLAANYAGMKFYLNLMREVKVGEVVYAPIAQRRDGVWVRNQDARTQLLRPLISDHFSEAMNPAWFDPPMRRVLRDAILARGPQWAAFYQTDRARELSRLAGMADWHGEPYGHCGFDELMTIVNAYFDVVERPAGASVHAD